LPLAESSGLRKTPQYGSPIEEVEDVLLPDSEQGDPLFGLGDGGQRVPLTGADIGEDVDGLAVKGALLDLHHPEPAFVVTRQPVDAGLPPVEGTVRWLKGPGEGLGAAQDHAGPGFPLTFHRHGITSRSP